MAVEIHIPEITIPIGQSTAVGAGIGFAIGMAGCAAAAIAGTFMLASPSRKTVLMVTTVTTIAGAVIGNAISAISG